MNPYRKNQRLVIGLVLAAIVAYFFLWWMPHRRKMAALQSQVRQAQQTIDDESARLNGISDVRAELAELHRYIAEIEQQLPDELNLPRFLSDLYAIAKELGVDIVQTQPQVPSRLVQLQTQPAHLTLAGRAPAIAELIYQLETGPRLIELTSLQMRASKRRRAGQVEAEIESRLFAQGGSEAQQRGGRRRAEGKPASKGKRDKLGSKAATAPSTRRHFR